MNSPPAVVVTSRRSKRWVELPFSPMPDGSHNQTEVFADATVGELYRQARKQVWGIKRREAYRWAVQTRKLLNDLARR